jgi:4-methyl-5(b-hydroxyethyl)-thiazole monophosphate biosynthesis
MKKILLLISQGAEILEVAPFIDIFGWNGIVGKKNTLLKTAGFHEIISNTWNLKLLPEINLKESKIDIDDYEALVIPGGFGFKGYFEDMKREEFRDIIRKFVDKDKFVIGICTGVIPLGEAGVLKNRKATTYLYDNDRYFNQLIKYGATPLREEIVIDNKIITCSAPKNAIEVGFLLLKFLTDEENMKKVKYNMGFL